MNNFGFNLLSTVQTVIGKQDYQIRKWVEKVTNAAGYDVDVYEEPETRSGSIQPIARGSFQNLGLDFSKNYIQIFDVELIDVLSRSENADQIIWQDSVYKAEGNFDWQNSGNWNSVLCVRVSDAG